MSVDASGKVMMHPQRRAAICAWLRLARFTDNMGHIALDHLRSWNLSLAQFDAILQLGHSGTMTQRQLATHLRVTEGDISQLLAKLEQRELIARSTEGRCKQVCLTETGQRLYTQVLPAHEDIIVAQFDSLTDSEIAQLSRLLRKLDRAAP